MPNLNNLSVGQNLKYLCKNREKRENQEQRTNQPYCEKHTVRTIIYWVNSYKCDVSMYIYMHVMIYFIIKSCGFFVWSLWRCTFCLNYRYRPGSDSYKSEKPHVLEEKRIAENLLAKYKNIQLETQIPDRKYGKYI